MKILHLNSYYSTRAFYENLFTEQLKGGLDLSVYVPVPMNFNNERLSSNSFMIISPNHTNFDRYTFFVKHEKILDDIIQRLDISSYTILHAHSLFSNGFIALRLKKQFGTPYLVTVRSTDINIFFKKMLHLRKIGINILDNADAITFLSIPHRDEVIRKYVPQQLRCEILKKTHVIPNGVDEFWLNNLAEPKNLVTEKDIRVITVGTIERRKNMLTTLKAVNTLNESGYSVLYTVIGDAKNKRIFKKLCRSRFISYLEPRAKEDLIEVYRNNDINVMPSITETFGLVYVEAMSQGLPIVYTKGEGFDGQFSEGVVGYHVDALDHNDVVNAIKLIADRYSELSESCIKMSGKFSWKRIASMYTEIYRNLLK